MGVITSCGKKARDENSSRELNLTKSEAEVDFNSLAAINQAIESNDAKTLRLILNSRPNLNLNNLDYYGETLLTKAISGKKESVAITLLDAGADINIANVNNETPLIVAINKNMSEFAKYLVSRGSDINKKDIFQDTALLISIKKKNASMALFLIERGANIFTNDRYGRSPYALSLIHDLPQVSEVLKKHFEIKFNEPTIEQFRDQILDAEFKFIARTLNRFSHLVLQYEEINPLGLLALRGNEEEAIEGAKLFTRWGAKIDGPPETLTNPPLIEAMLHRKYRYVNFLIEKGANTNILGVEGRPPLHYAIELNDFELVSKLLKSGAQKRMNEFDACKVAKSIQEELRTSSDKATNKQIRKLLFCTFLSRF